MSRMFKTWTGTPTSRCKSKRMWQAWRGQPVTSTRRFGAKLVVATVWVHRKRQLVRS